MVGDDPLVGEVGAVGPQGRLVLPDALDRVRLEGEVVQSGAGSVVRPLRLLPEGEDEPLAVPEEGVPPASSLPSPTRAKPRTSR